MTPFSKNKGKTIASLQTHSHLYGPFLLLQPSSIGPGCHRRLCVATTDKEECTVTAACSEGSCARHTIHTALACFSCLYYCDVHVYI